MFLGAITALITPFDEKGKINYEKLAELIAFQIQNGSDGIVLLGTTGEASAITEEEGERIVRMGVACSAGRIPVIVGVSACDTETAVRRARHFSSLGADALLVLTPYYNKTNEAGIMAHFQAIADASSVPIILYHVPSRTGCRMTVRVVAHLREHPNIIGIKEASGEIACFSEIVSLARGDFSVWSGCDDMTLVSVALGAAGVISVVSNILPRQMHDLVALTRAGALEPARKLQLSLLPLIRALFSEGNPIPIKEAMRALAFDVGGYRLPLCEMGEENRCHLLQELEKWRDVIPKLS